MRLIDANALRDRLQSLAYDDWNQGVNTSWENAYNECADMVDDMPTIEPQRMRGKWIEPTEDNDYWECPVCHDTYELDVDVTPQDARMFFCPNCGADMRGTE